MLSASSCFDYARRLRKNMTDAERKLSYRIKRKQLGVRFRRQQPIGRHIVNFVCFERKVIIEVDGGQHDQCLRDTKRDACFSRQGYHVLRFWNLGFVAVPHSWFALQLFGLYYNSFTIVQDLFPPPNHFMRAGLARSDADRRQCEEVRDFSRVLSEPVRDLFPDRTQFSL